MKILVGSFTFFDEQIDGYNRAIIHNAVEIEGDENDDDFLESLIVGNQGYLIPELYQFEIIDERK